MRSALSKFPLNMSDTFGKKDEPDMAASNLERLCVEAAQDQSLRKSGVTWVDGAIIVGAGPSGMATAASLRSHQVPYVILEKSECIASLWKQRTYDRLRLHIAKKYCELPLMAFPESYPVFLSKSQFLDYLHEYAEKFCIQPRFNEIVRSASFDECTKTWLIKTEKREATLDSWKATYIGRWLVVASGENEDAVLPNILGLGNFKGRIIHSGQFKSGDAYAGMEVLVIGAGNSGMEIALDLLNSRAKPSMVVRNPLHVLPREMLGMSTFSVAMLLMKWFPVWFVDELLCFYARWKLGDTSLFGLNRPKLGPLELKNKMGKTPILDIGAVSKIKNGDIKVMPEVHSLTDTGAHFVDGTHMSYDAVILATGYKSNAQKWLGVSIVERY
eukprot:c24792_g1_i2 orf=102-1259(+)